MFSKFLRRSGELEHIDIGDYTSEEYEGCLGELQLVNEWMGDARALRKSLLKKVEEEDLKHFSVLDVGAGSGELLRVAAGWAQEEKRNLRAIGLELNERSARAIKEQSRSFSGIEATRGDALRLPFGDATFDYVISSLFTHHFLDEQVVQILKEMARVAARRIFVIDLHRHPIAYYFYTTVGKIILHNRLIREDGALSILRSFKADELFSLAQRAGLKNISVTKHFPYRLVLEASAQTAREVPLTNPIETDQAA